MPSVIFSLISGVFGGITGIITKSFIVPRYSSRSYLFLFTLLGTIFSLPLLLINHQLSTNPEAYVFLLGSAISVAIAYFFTLSAYKGEDASNIAIVSKINLVVSFLGGVLLFGESLTVYKLAGAFFCHFGYYHYSIQRLPTQNL